MPSFESFKNLGQGVFFWIVTAIAILGIIWAFVLSPIGNYINSRNEVPAPPQTIYKIGVHNTGQILFTDSYTVTPSEKNPALHIYTLDKYYALVKNKFKYYDKSLSMDEYYWGEIEVRRR